MGEFQSVAKLKIHDGKLDEFKRLELPHCHRFSGLSGSAIP